ncbi:MAG: proline--tRNA ligase, partial [Thaumarchaeota archaeon]|nr:proline--tRNA ligase [Nitrososphaerota archaeon]
VDDLGVEVGKELDAIQENLLRNASEALSKNTHEADSLPELKKIMAEKGGIVRIHWCGKEECETKLKEEAGGKILNIPIDQKPSNAKCLVCGSEAKFLVNFGKSY